MLKDLHSGQAAEKRVIQLFEACDLTCTINQSTKIQLLRGWDFSFELDNSEWLVEVKFDRYQAKSGNIAIEYFNPSSGQKSGIEATISDIWVVVLMNGTMWGANTHVLREYFRNNKGLRDVLCGGDGNATFRLYRDREILNAVFMELKSQDLLTTISELLA